MGPRALLRCLAVAVVMVPTVAAAWQQQVEGVAISPEIQAAASHAVSDARAKAKVTALTDHAALASDVAHAERAKLTYLRGMYQQNLPATAAAASRADSGEHILMFASMSMTPTDMHGMLEAAMADPRITITFLGGEKHGGVEALLKWIAQITQGMNGRPPIQINPPAFHKYHVTEVPYAVVLRDGQEVGRVGGVVDPRWIDAQLRTHSGNLGDFGRMSLPSEEDLGAQLADRVRHFDWKGYMNRQVDGFWRNLAMPTVPHATKAVTYRIDPTVTITHDIRTPDGLLIARAGTKANPLKVAPFDVELIVIDGSDPNQRTFARERARADLQAGHAIKVLSTTVPAKAPDGWAAWAAWQSDVGSHLYAYLPAMAERMRLTGTPSIVTGDGLYVKVEQIALTGTDPGGKN